MNRSRDGFTLIEMLVVIIIILILATALIVMLVNLIDRAKYEKGNAIIKALDGGCSSYFAEFKQFPPSSPYTDSQNLHWYLGRQFLYIVQQGKTGDPQYGKEHPPFIEFKSDWLAGNPVSTDPNPPCPVVDPWGSRVLYSIDNPPKTVTIRSPGSNKVINDEDDLHNKLKEH